MQTWCMHTHALSVPYIFQILLYDICTHMQNRCAYTYTCPPTHDISTGFLHHWGEWLQQNPALWESWLPNETACTSGKGLVNVSLGSSLGAVAPGASRPRIGTGWPFMTMEWNWKTGTFRDFVMKPWDILRFSSMQFLHGRFFDSIRWRSVTLFGVMLLCSGVAPLFERKIRRRSVTLWWLL